MRYTKLNNETIKYDHEIKLYEVAPVNVYNINTLCIGSGYLDKETAITHVSSTVKNQFKKFALVEFTVPANTKVWSAKHIDGCYTAKKAKVTNIEPVKRKDIIPTPEEKKVKNVIDTHLTNDDINRIIIIDIEVDELTALYSGTTKDWINPVGEEEFKKDIEGMEVVKAEVKHGGQLFVYIR